MPAGSRPAAHVRDAPDIWLLAAALVLTCTVGPTLFTLTTLAPLLGHCIAFFPICVALHGVLVDSRLPAGQLTVFSLAMATGGRWAGSSTPWSRRCSSTRIGIFPLLLLPLRA